MTQEIYNYLLIRNYLIQDNDEYSLEGEENPKEQYAFFVNAVAELMQHENYPLISEQMQEEISNIIQKYRFDYMKDKELNESINYIITRLREYELLSYKRKNNLIRDWYKDEYNNRMLPYKYRNPDCMNLLLSCDFRNYEKLTNVFTFEEFLGSYKLQDDVYSISKYASFLSTINLMITFDSAVLNPDEKMRLINNIIVLGRTLDITVTDARYAKRTANYVYSTISKEDIKEKRLVI